MSCGNIGLFGGSHGSGRHLVMVMLVLIEGCLLLVLLVMVMVLRLVLDIIVVVVSLQAGASGGRTRRWVIDVADRRTIVVVVDDSAGAVNRLR